jgi:hypothetical protein
MEGKKSTLKELPALEAELLQLCIFSESFGMLVNECTVERKESVIADAIKNLIHFKLLIASNEANSMTWMYDSDKMRESSFKATARGIGWIENYTKSSHK